MADSQLASRLESTRDLLKTIFKSFRGPEPGPEGGSPGEVSSLPGFPSSFRALGSLCVALAFLILTESQLVASKYLFGRTGPWTHETCIKFSNFLSWEDRVEARTLQLLRDDLIFISPGSRDLAGVISADPASRAGTLHAS